MELHETRNHDYRRPQKNNCAQYGETIFIPEWSEYLDRHRVESDRRLPPRWYLCSAYSQGREAGRSSS